MLLLWLRSLLITLAIEIPIFVLVARREVPAWRAALVGAAGTLVTHPALWFVWPHIVRDAGTYVVTGEFMASVLESATFLVLARPRRLATAIAASFLANGGSYSLGGLLRSLGWLW